MRVVIVAERHTAAAQTVMLNQLLQLQLDLRTVHALRRYVSLHENAVEAPGNPGVRVDIVFHAGDVLSSEVAVSDWDGVCVVAQSVHHAHLGGADAHD